MVTYKKIIMIGISTMIAFISTPSLSQGNIGADINREVVSEMLEERGISAKVDVVVDSERRPMALIYTITNISSEPIKLWGRLSDEDFEKNISINQADFFWRSRTSRAIVTPRLAPGEILASPESEAESKILDAGESLTWEYEMHELIDDYEAFEDQENLRRLSVVTDLFYVVAGKDSEFDDGELLMMHLRWYRGARE